MRCSWPLMMLVAPLIGCAEMEGEADYGAIVRPIEIEEPEPPPAPVVKPDPEPDPDIFKEPKVLNSDQFSQPSPPPVPEFRPQTTRASLQLPVAIGSINALVKPPRGGTGWPLRVAATHPEMNPPKAILGLPDGSEVVVEPGQMIPQYGVVVMSIGPKGAELAYIMPSGDYASVQTVALQNQY